MSVQVVREIATNPAFDVTPYIGLALTSLEGKLLITPSGLVYKFGVTK